MFDDLPTLTVKKDLRDELERYLGMETEQVLDALLWWFEHKKVYPRLSRMALDYLSIPGESINS
jgi:hAT family C-terminal dimerisation region